MNTQDFIQALQSMGLLDPENNDAALAKFGDVVSILDLSSDFNNLGPNGGIPDHIITMIYSELGGIGSFSVRSQDPTGSEPVNHPRTIAAADEPGEPVGEPGVIAPLIFDESIIPQELLDELEANAKKVEDALTRAIDARLDRINTETIMLASIKRRWGNVPGGKA